MTGWVECSDGTTSIANGDPTTQEVTHVLEIDLRAIKEEADHEHGGPLCPGGGGWCQLESQQHRCYSDGVHNDDLRSTSSDHHLIVRPFMHLEFQMTGIVSNIQWLTKRCCSISGHAIIVLPNTNPSQFFLDHPGQY